jgi:hypothetical protein
MVPAKDFVISKQFYCDLGFLSKMLTDGLAELSLGHDGIAERVPLGESKT